MSTSNELERDWNFRITASREVAVKGKSDSAQKVSVLDVLTNSPFPLEVPKDFPLESLAIGKAYFVTFKVYTRKSMKGVSDDFVEFFEALDVDQSVEDFEKAYWIYPTYIRFELAESEPM